MKILVTGCAGFIGFHLTKRLIDLNFQVIGIDNINDYYDIRLKHARLEQLGIYAKNLSDNSLVRSSKYAKLKFYKMDISDQASISKLFDHSCFDIVCNLAAQAGVRYSIINPGTYIQSNVQGFFNILESSRRNNIKHLIYASSSSVYGLNKELPFSTASKTDQPASLYAATKKCNELLAHSYSHLFNLKTTGLRFFTVYGPWGRPDMAMYLFTKAIAEGMPVKVFNDGKMKRDFTYIDDVVDGILRVITKSSRKDHVESNDKIPYKVYNVGKGCSVSLGQFITEIERKIGSNAIREYMPMQDGDVEETWADILPMKRDFQYSPCTEVAEGVGHFVDWYQAYYTDVPNEFAALLTESVK
ncbi:MAG: NAD-dependent epimerase/dehydratase family protein [Flavobacterium sp.]|nr:MAG: NAD-dependent epimerase/dehydratase family protein [Flavobacterium sp.]